MKITKLTLSTVLVGAAAFVAGMLLPAASASAHPHHAVPGVCVAYGTLPLIDRDVRFAASIYTPAAQSPRCAKGDSFVAVEPSRR